MKELSIFVDESGDFGEYDYHAPYYIISMVIHRQGVDISQDLIGSLYWDELLSVGSEVQILSGTPENTAASLFRGLQRFFVPPSPGNFTSVTGRFLYAA